MTEPTFSTEGPKPDLNGLPPPDEERGAGQQAPGTEQYPDAMKPSGSWLWEAPGSDPLTPLQGVLVVLCCVLPSVAALVFLSAVFGVGLQVYNAVAPLSVVGDGVLAAAALVLTLLYVLDIYSFPKAGAVASCVAAACLVTAGALLKGCKHPWAPILLMLGWIPVALFAVRLTLCRKTSPRTFYLCVVLGTSVSFVIAMAAWLFWMIAFDNLWNNATRRTLAAGLPNVYKNVYSQPLDYAANCTRMKTSGLWRAARTRAAKTRVLEVRTACATANSIWFLVYCVPLITAVVNLLLCLHIGLVRLMNAAVVRAHGQGGTTEVQAVTLALKWFMILTICLFGAMYCSSWALADSHYQLGSTVTAFFGAILALNILWVGLEVGPDCLVEGCGVSRAGKFGTLLRKLWKNDWVRAVVVGMVNCAFPLPIFLLLNMVRQWVKKHRGLVEPGSGKFTENAQKFLDRIASWNWASILTKVAILAELLFVLQVGFSKVTYIFLSWLRSALARISFGYVVGLVWGIGFLLFLLPPVPGVAVYVFCGLVIPTQGVLAGSSFVVGVLLATVVAFSCKLVASGAQCGLGVAFAQSVRVQKFIAVDSVITRALEDVLKQPGLGVGKVAILVGGPDWPTSVTCGILRVNFPQMMLGTLPVVFTIAPMVLAGAAQVQTDGIWPQLKTPLMVLAAGLQNLCAGLGVYYIANVAEAKADELSQPRPEHQAVEELTKREQHSNDVYREVTRWRVLSFGDKLVMLVMTAAFLLSGCLFLFLDSVLFLDFKVSTDISASIAAGGLDGNPLNIIIIPYGSIVLGLFAFGVFLQIFHILTMNRRHKWA